MTCGFNAGLLSFCRRVVWEIYWILQAENGYPGTQGYTLTECLSDLLGIAARALCLGGRLVYFLPAAPNTCEGEDVPAHPTLRMVSNCEQVGCSPHPRASIVMPRPMRV